MGFPLRQSTASQSRALGPFIDSTDFATPLTGLTIANTDIKLVVNGGASANKNSGGGTHRVNGVYGVTFDATDTATVGELEVNVNVSGALMVFDKFPVLEEAIYDALYAASAPGYLQPTTAGRTLDVTATGAAGIDWNNIENQTATVGFTNTTVGRTTLNDLTTLTTLTTTATTLTNSGNPKKNTALAAFPFLMTATGNHDPVTGAVVTVTRSIDGGAFASGTLSVVTEVGDGIYVVDFGAGDLNGNNIILKATATGCDVTLERITTAL